MRLKQFLCAGALVLSTVSLAQAALAPNYQRIAELQAILDDPSVVDAFNVSQPIDRVESLKADLYRVTAGSCHVDVAIVDVPDKEQRVGPRQFKVEIVARSCPD
jgi:hypothetical protein